MVSQGQEVEIWKKRKSWAPLVEITLFLYLLGNMIRGGIITYTGIHIWGPLLPVPLLIYLSVKGQISIDRRYVGWQLFFLLFCLFSVGWSINPKLSLYVFKNIIPIVCLSLVLMQYIRSENELFRVIFIFYACAVFLCLYSFFFVDIRSMEDRHDLGAEFDAWNLNSVAVDLVYGFFFGFLWTRRFRKKGSLPVLLLFSLLSLYIILLSGSRRALLVLAIFVLLYFALLTKIGFVKKILIVGIVLGGAGLLVFSGPFYNYIGVRIVEMFNILQGDSHGDNSRLILILDGLEWFKDKPVFGHGINCFRELSNQTYEFAGKNFYAHNNYVELLVDVGVIGLLLYYLPLFGLLFRAGQIKNSAAFLSITLCCVALFSDLTNVGYYMFDTQLLLLLSFLLVSRGGRFKLMPNEKR